jgi:hypothetical protein
MNFALRLAIDKARSVNMQKLTSKKLSNAVLVRVVKVKSKKSFMKVTGQRA